MDICQTLLKNLGNTEAVAFLVYFGFQGYDGVSTQRQWLKILNLARIMGMSRLEFTITFYELPCEEIQPEVK